MLDLRHNKTTNSIVLFKDCLEGELSKPLIIVRLTNIIDSSKVYYLNLVWNNEARVVTANVDTTTNVPANGTIQLSKGTYYAYFFNELNFTTTPSMSNYIHRELVMYLT